MTELNDNGLNNQEDYLNTDSDKTQDVGNADAAQFNSQDQEKAVNEREETETNDLERLNNTNDTETQQPLTTQGNFDEMEENMGGTTNLTLDQLKQEGDPEGMNDR